MELAPPRRGLIRPDGLVTVILVAAVLMLIVNGTAFFDRAVEVAASSPGEGVRFTMVILTLNVALILVGWRRLTATINQDPESAAIVRAVASLASAIKVPVVVEGIEDAATHATVLGYGCEMGQGWYFGQSMSADQAEQLIKRVPVAAAPRRAVS